MDLYQLGEIVYMDLFGSFSGFEDQLIRKFHKHPFFKNFGDLTDRELKKYLLQKWFLSFNFVPWYDKAILSLNNQTAKLVLKKIVQDESPPNAPSHREDLIEDLEFIGIKKAEILTAKPTDTTLNTLGGLFSLAAFSKDDYNDLRIMVSLRLAGEVLVGEEYRHLVPELEKRIGLKPTKSVFYAPHFYHDRKDAKSGHHTHSFTSVLEGLIRDGKSLGKAKSAAEKAFRVRLGFFDQFSK